MEINMSYIEIKAIKAVAAVHRGIVNTALRTLTLREKLAARKLCARHKYAGELESLARATERKALVERTIADNKWRSDSFAIAAATHTVLNLRDDLNKIS